MHDVPAPDAGERKPCLVVNYRDLKAQKNTDL